MIIVFGVVVCVIGGSVGLGGMGVGGQGPGSGIVLLLPVTKQYTLKYSSAVSLDLKFYIAHIMISLTPICLSNVKSYLMNHDISTWIL